jgi:hypothetical protein
VGLGREGGSAKANGRAAHARAAQIVQAVQGGGVLESHRAARSHLLEVGQLTIAVGWCYAYVVCNKAPFTRGRARPEGHS